MNLTVPLYVEERSEPGRRPVYVVRPVYRAAPVRQADLVSRAVARVTQDLRLELASLAREPRHDELAARGRAPELTEHLLDLSLELRRSRGTLRLLVLAHRWQDRLLAFSPALPSVSFEVSKKAELAARATEVYTAHYRAQERADGPPPPYAGARGFRAWLAWAEVSVDTRRTLEREDRDRKIALARAERVSGELELQRTGTCVTWEDPDTLPGATGRDAELDALDALLSQRTRRPVLLLGPRQAGKTALVHELVRRTADRPGRRVIWHLSPQRLIAGMSVVGAWEQRVLAILTAAREKDLVLYFDDVLGLYAAGIAAGSDLSVAHVLRQPVEERRVRVIAEMTPEEFRLLKERDRGFADGFHVLPVRETPPPETLRIAMAVVRELEARTPCRFAFDVVPAVLDVCARHARDVAFPGKAAAFLRQLAAKHGDAEVKRDDVLAEFSARSGLALAFLDGRRTGKREEVVDALSRRVIGQPAAVDALADAVTIARARLSDPARPLASLLFLGPTGVGKTECARALAAYLFGDASRLVRLDMNEYLSPGSAARLTGTFHEPEGLLTAAVRRQPFSVVLLDEIEKAHPDVLDLLLQVLGDGRLTDGRGRTTDFANTIVVMTSNLGARESTGTPGFGGAARDADQLYRRAAQAFFRPELFNRIDRVVPFARLAREHVAAIAHAMIAAVLARGGFRERRCQLSVDPRALESIVDAGFHPELGARALRRAVESQLAQPVAEQLAALPAGAPALIRVLPGEHRLVVTTDAYAVRAPAPREPLRGRAGELIDLFEARLAALEAPLSELAPGEVEAGRIAPEHLRYFAVREQLQRASRLLDAAGRKLAVRAAVPARAAPPLDLARVLASENPRAELEAQAGAPAPRETLESLLAALATEVVAAERMLASARAGAGTRVELVAEPLVPAALTAARALRQHYRDLFEDWPGFTVRAGDDSIVVEGPAADDLLRGELGTHLFVEGPALVPVAVRTPGDPGALGPVRRLYDDACRTADVDTATTWPGRLTAAQLRAMLLARLEAP